MAKITKEIQFGEHLLVLETGEIARQADGAVFVSMSPVMVVKAPQVGADAPLLVNTCPVVPAAVNASSVPLPIAAAPAVGVLLPLIITLIKSSTFEKCRWLLSLMY